MASLGLEITGAEIKVRCSQYGQIADHLYLHQTCSFVLHYQLEIAHVFLHIALWTENSYAELVHGGVWQTMLLEALHTHDHDMDRKLNWLEVLLLHCIRCLTFRVADASDVCAVPR